MIILNHPQNIGDCDKYWMHLNRSCVRTQSELISPLILHKMAHKK